MLEGQFRHCLEDVLDKGEIDKSYIDNSLTYRENSANLYKQFGVKFAKTNYNKQFRKADEIANQTYPAQKVARVKAKAESWRPLVKEDDRWGEI